MQTDVTDEVRTLRWTLINAAKETLQDLGCAQVAVSAGLFLALQR
jgi:hypothetical protein